MAVMVVVGDPGVVIVATTGPLTCDQVPTPTRAVFPAIVAEPGDAQIVWLGPAFDVVGTPLTIMLTWLDEAGHGALVMVHWNT